MGASVPNSPSSALGLASLAALVDLRASGCPAEQGRLQSTPLRTVVSQAGHLSPANQRVFPPPVGQLAFGSGPREARHEG